MAVVRSRQSSTMSSAVNSPDLTPVARSWTDRLPSSVIARDLHPRHEKKRAPHAWSVAEKVLLGHRDPRNVVSLEPLGGDSIFGYKAHLGAGVKISNVKIVPGNVTVEIDGEPFDTGLRKFGAMLGDRVEVGCNAVLNPGSVIGRDSVIYPCVNWRGVLVANMIAKNRSIVETVERKIQ